MALKSLRRAKPHNEEQSIPGRSRGPQNSPYAPQRLLFLGLSDRKGNIGPGAGCFLTGLGLGLAWLVVFFRSWNWRHVGIGRVYGRVGGTGLGCLTLDFTPFLHCAVVFLQRLREDVAPVPSATK